MRWTIYVGKSDITWSWDVFSDNICLARIVRISDLTEIIIEASGWALGFGRVGLVDWDRRNYS